MVIAVVAKQAIEFAIRHGTRYFKFEKKAFDKLYKDFPPGVSTGVRHGLAGGSVIGSALDTPGNEFQKEKQGEFSKTGPPNKARYRPTGRTYGRRRNKCRPNRYRRRSSTY